MDVDLKVAYLIAEALTTGQSAEDLARLQIMLQTLASLVAANLAMLKSKGSNSTG